MSCSNENNWTIKFPAANGFEVRPIEMSLKFSRSKYDFCHGEISYEAGEVMKPETRHSDGLLYDISPVEVRYDGNVIRYLMFRPDWINYQDDRATFDLKDLHKSLSDGTVNIQQNSAKLRDIYEKVVESAPRQAFKDIKFTLPDSQVRTIYGKNEFKSAVGPSAAEREAESEITKDVLESDYAIDFDEISPERAIQRLNEKFNVYSWVNRAGELVIGLPEANRQTHIAAPDDSRAWRFKDPNIRHGREPIRKVTVEGAWVDEPGIGGYDDAIDEVASWMGLADDNEKGGADVRAMGYAYRNDIDYGKEFTIKSTKAKRDALSSVAKLALVERMKKQNNGNITIDPGLSGTEYSNPIDLNPGDFLHVVPDDRHFDDPTADSGSISNPIEDTSEICGGYVNNEIYLVSGVEHKIDRNGDWKIHADLSIYPDVEIKTLTMYFNPETGMPVGRDELDENGDLKDNLFESI